jgi:uncharacterized membrane protein YbhN (UPF0104 family)
VAAGSEGAARLRWPKSFWLKLVVSALLLGAQAWRSDLGELRRSLTSVQPGWLLGAVLLYAASHVLSVFRWVLLARPLGFTEPIGRFFSFYFSGMFMNLFAPGTVAGDVGRGLFLAGGRRRPAALATVIAQRAIGFLAMAWIGVTALRLFPAAVFPPALVTLTTVFAVLSAPVVWWGPRLAVRFLPRGHAARRFVEVELRPLWFDRRQVFWSLLTAFAYHGLQIGSQVLAARSLAIAAPASFFFAFVPLVNVAVMAPVSFSGIGVRESGFRYFLSGAGVDAETALALGLLSSAIAVSTGLLGAPAFLRGARSGAAADA